MGTVQAWRKPIDSIKDHIQVGLAHVSDFKGVNVAIVKATNHVEIPPEERYIRKIMVATSSMRPRADVVYCIRALSRRIKKTHNWTVALKTLIVIHRTMREGGPAFIEGLHNVKQADFYFIPYPDFKDDSSPIASDCSKWVTTYGRFLRRRIILFWMIKYDNGAECLPRTGQGEDRGYSKNGYMNSRVLFHKLSNLQSHLLLLTECRPEGTAMGTYIVQYALVLVLKESFKMYSYMNDLMIELVDRFFEMPRHEAIKALSIYKTALQSAARVSDFYEFCRGIVPDINFQVPVLREPPQSFLVSMEEYMNEAPIMISDPNVALESGTPTPEPLPRSVPAAEIPAAESSISPSSQQLHNSCNCCIFSQHFPLLLFFLFFMLAFKLKRDG